MVAQTILGLDRKELNALLCLTFFDWWIDEPEPGIKKYFPPYYKSWSEQERMHSNGCVPTDFSSSLCNQQELLKQLEAKHGLYVLISTYDKEVAVFNDNATKSATSYYQDIKEIPLLICQTALIAYYS